MSKGRTRVLDKGDLNGSQTKFSPDLLIEALYDVEDLFARCMCPFLLLDETARQCFQQKGNLYPNIDLSEVTVGVKESEFTASVKSTFKTVRPDAEWMPTNVSYIFKGVPVVIWRIKKSYRVIDNPDRIFFYTEEFNIPNPFREYWNMRHLIT